MWRLVVRGLSYAQGQVRGRTREYFYFVDHQGMVSDIQITLSPNKEQKTDLTDQTRH
jgi:hypothetical protein